MSDVKCTWAECEHAATQPQVSTDGRVWANLCDEHAERFESAVKAGDAKRMLGCWVKAQGGAKLAAASFSRRMA